MFGSFRRHQKWIWILGVIVIIPSFVIFFTPEMEQRFMQGGSGGGGTSDAYLVGDQPVTIAGKAVTRQEVSKAVNEIVLSRYLRSGQWPTIDEALRREGIFRVFIIERLRQMDIRVSDAAAARMARSWLGSYPYENFTRDVLAVSPHKLTSEDFERFARHEAAIQQLVAAASLNSQLLTPDEARFIYERENREKKIEVTAFWTSNYVDQVEATPEAVATFYTNSMGRYRVPERIQVSYVAFEATNYLDKADVRINELTNLAERIDAFYDERGTNTFVDTNDVILTAEAAKDQIRESLRTDTALNLAHQAANEFGNELFMATNPQDPANLDRIAAAQGLPVQVTEPFSRFEAFEELGLPEAFRQTAVGLSTNNPVSWTPVPGTNAVYLMAFKNRVPSKLQTYEEVQDKLLADFQETEANKLAMSAATNFYTILTNGMAQGQSFSEVAAAQNAPLVEVPPFATSTTTLTNLDSRLELPRLQGMVARMETGEVSPFTRLRDGVIIVHFLEELPIDPAKMDQELPDMMARLRALRRSESSNEWLGRQAQRAPVSIPDPPQETAPLAPIGSS